MRRFSILIFQPGLKPNKPRFYELWDGALGGFNNPVVAGIIEAIKLGVPKSEISIVSLGTGNKLMSAEDKEQFYKIKQCAIEDRRKKWNFLS